MSGIVPFDEYGEYPTAAHADPITYSGKALDYPYEDDEFEVTNYFE